MTAATAARARADTDSLRTWITLPSLKIVAPVADTVRVARLGAQSGHLRSPVHQLPGQSCALPGPRPARPNDVAFVRDRPRSGRADRPHPAAPRGHGPRCGTVVPGGHRVWVRGRVRERGVGSPGELPRVRQRCGRCGRGGVSSGGGVDCCQGVRGGGRGRGRGVGDRHGDQRRVAEVRPAGPGRSRHLRGG